MNYCENCGQHNTDTQSMQDVVEDLEKEVCQKCISLHNRPHVERFKHPWKRDVEFH